MTPIHVRRMTLATIAAAGGLALLPVAATADEPDPLAGQLAPAAVPAVDEAGSRQPLARLAGDDREAALELLLAERSTRDGRRQQ